MTTINGRTPEEIKKGLECCIAQRDGRCEEYVACVCCPYFSENPSAEDALAYIQQLELERNAAVEDVHGVCCACIHFNERYNPGDIMSCCKFEECIHGADDFESEDHWQWRGVKEGKQ